MAEKLSEAFQQFCGVVRPRPGSDMNAIASGAVRLYRALLEYPEPVAVTALDLYCRRETFFPAEKELRDVLEEVNAEAMREARTRGHDDGAYYQPVGRTVQFVAKVREIYGNDYVKSWLSGGINARFTNDKLLVTGSAKDRLEHDAGYMARMYGVSIEKDDKAENMLRDYCEQRGLTEQKKVRK